MKLKSLKWNKEKLTPTLHLHTKGWLDTIFQQRRKTRQQAGVPINSPVSLYQTKVVSLTGHQAGWTSIEYHLITNAPPLVILFLNDIANIN